MPALPRAQPVGELRRRQPRSQELSPERRGLSELDQVDAGERAAELLHDTAGDQAAQVDCDEARAVEQPDHLGLRIDVVAREKDHSAATGLVRIGREHRRARRNAS
jgi:hypothetical protein